MTSQPAKTATNGTVPGLRQPIHRAMKILAWLVDNGGADTGVRELARAVDIPAPTVHRILAALAEEGFVVSHEASGRWSIGPEFWRLALRGSSRLTVSAVASRHLVRVVEQCNETAFLTVYDARKMRTMFAVSVESTQPIRYIVELHQWSPITFAASGLAIVASLSDEERTAIYETNEMDSEGIDRIENTLREVRRLGYAQTRGVKAAGAVGVAAPIFDTTAQVIGSVGVTVPEQRFDIADTAAMRAAVVRCAHDTSADLGGIRVTREIPSSE